MDLFQKSKKLIDEARNIYILPSIDNQDESVSTSLALFYTLKKLQKNVNLIIDKFPEKFQFLIPSLDFISEPKNFVISIPSSKAEVSQIQYEKDKEGLKIYLTLDKGNIKKNDISFCFNISKPDLLITVGNKNLPLDQSFNIECPILNIDNQTENENFGQVNLIKNNFSLAEIVNGFLKSIDNDLIEKDIATCLLTGIIISSGNFQNQKTSTETFEAAAFLIKKGASHQQIINHLYKSKSLPRVKFLSKIFRNLNFEPKKEISWAVLDSPNFQDLTDSDASFITEQLNFFNLQNLLVLWKSHASGPLSKGFFYSEKTDLSKKILENYQGTMKNNSVFFSVENSDLNFVKDKILKTLIS